MEMLKGLNKKQLEVVKNITGQILVLAGAGSGKTKAVTSKIIYLINELKVKPEEILAVTFTNKAAKEMKDRVAPKVNCGYWDLNIFTFHSFCVNLLRREVDFTKLKKNFVIYDTSESIAVMKKVLKDFNVDPKELPPKEVLRYIEKNKNQGYVYSSPELDKEHEFYAYYVEYEKELQKSSALDFGSIIVATLDLIRTNKRVLKKYQKQFKYIMVDEYQDTNKAQFDLINMLAAHHKNICVVGDIDQSIYSFRDADVRNILKFEEIYPDTKIIKLEQNYRSTKNIIEAATAVISHNVYRKEKDLWTDNDEGSLIDIVECHSDKDEAVYVINSIVKLRDYDNTAIFYRNNYQSRLIEEALLKRNIPYKIVGGMRFYERKEIKDIICYLRMIVNPHDNYSLVRVINTPARGVGKKTIDNLLKLAKDNNISLWSVLCSKELKVSKKALASIRLFVKVIKGASAELSSGSLISCFDYILSTSGYLEALKNSKLYEDKARIENLQELKRALYDYTKKDNPLGSFLEDSSLDTQEEDVGDGSAVTLMTVHSSKGLEFKNVILIGAEQGTFPSSKSLEEEDPILGEEEERRLFYVAMTRAEENLIITYSTYRYKYGSGEYMSKSHFLYEVPNKYTVKKRFKIERW